MFEVTTEQLEMVSDFADIPVRSRLKTSENQARFCQIPLVFHRCLSQSYKGVKATTMKMALITSQICIFKSENEQAERFARAFFIFCTFGSRSRSYYDVKLPVLQ